MDTRYHSKNLQFEVKDITPEQVEDFAKTIEAGTVVVLNPFVGGNNMYSVYATKKNGAPFNFNNGSRSLAKKLRCNPHDVQLVHVKKNQKMPDKFFEMINPDNIEEGFGHYADKKLIKSKIDAILRQNKNQSCGL